MTRYCPQCGAAVPDNALTCPKCYTAIPRSGNVNGGSSGNRAGYSEQRAEPRIGPNTKSHMVTLLLSTIPVIAGFLGLGAIYQEPRNAKGYVFLILGLFVFWTMIFMIVTLSGRGLASALLLGIATVMFALIYISMAIAAFVSASMDSLSPFKFRF